MSEENINKTKESQAQEPGAENQTAAQGIRESSFSVRNYKSAVAVKTLLVLVLMIFGMAQSCWERGGDGGGAAEERENRGGGIIDNYVKRQFVARLAESGITFEAEVFDVTLNPLKVYMKNAVFVNQTTGEKLFTLDETVLGLTVTNLYAMELTREINLDSVFIDGSEFWVTFQDERTNWSELNFVEGEEGIVGFKFTSAKVALLDTKINLGEEQRKIDADLRNVEFFAQPYNPEAPDKQKIYLFEYTSTESIIEYEDSDVQPVGVYAQGYGNGTGAVVTLLKLDSPIGTSQLEGVVSDWEQLKYQFQIQSNVDLTQASNILPLGTPIRGTGAFQGTVTGVGDEYRIEGEITSDTLATSQFYLRGVNVNATVQGKEATYQAEGKAVAELLTFDDFRIEFPQLTGNVRGTGTDFRWVGELQAAAAKSPLGTIGGLFITDAVAEYKDERLTAELGSVRARNFNSEDIDAQGLRTGNVRIVYNGNRTYVLTPAVSADRVATEDATLQNVSVRDVEVTNRGDATTARIGAVQAGRIVSDDTRLANVTARDVRVRSNGDTVIEAQRLQAGSAVIDGNNVGGITAANLNVRINDNRTVVYSDRLRLASVSTDAAVLGSVNIAGVRMTIRDGRIEGTSNTINLGDVRLTNRAVEGGGRLENVTLRQPVFVLEPSGRYRASADMSLGGGVLGSINLGAVRANVTATDRQVDLDNLNANLLGGDFAGNATIGLSSGVRSEINGNFSNLDIGRLLALQGGRAVPIEGETTGRVNLTFPGTNFERASGDIIADINAQAGAADRDQVPVTGRVELRAQQGVFNIEQANLQTLQTQLTATGQFDLAGNQTNLDVALNSASAGEVQRLINVLEISPELEQQLDRAEVELAGNLTFKGNITGDLNNPAIDGRAELETVSLRGQPLGSLASNITVAPGGDIRLTDGILREPDGGNVAFNVIVPGVGTNNISVEAQLNNYSLGKLLAAAPFELPPTLRGLQAETSGRVNLTGLPNEIQGEANLTATQGKIDGETFDNLETRLTFAQNQLNIEQFDLRFGDGFVRAGGNYNLDTQAVNLELNAKDVRIQRLRPFIPNNEDLPDVRGEVDLTAQINGIADQPATYNVTFSGIGRDITVGDRAFGQVEFKGTTENRQLQANITATISGQPQNITANVNFADENLPFRAETVFQDTNLEPFLNLVQLPGSVPVSGRATGRVVLEGNLRDLNQQGELEFTTANLTGRATFEQLALQIDETSLAATEPVSVRFTSNEVIVENAKFAGNGTNVVVTGTYALNEKGTNNLAVDGSVNLRVLNALSDDVFFSGIANVEMRLTGNSADPRLIGTANVDNGTVSVFVGSERLTLQRVDARVLFTTNQAQIQEFTGFLGGGRITASGGALLDGLELQAFRLNIQGNNITAPLPEDVITTGDAQIEITGRRGDNNLLTTFVSGTFNARRALYTEDIDLADIIGGRSEGSITQGGGGGDSFLGDTRLDLRIIGRDALVVRNNLADLTASLDLRVTGDIDEPQIAGRVTANSGTIFFRDNRYEVMRGVVEFPPNTTFEPYVNILAETEIRGYQVMVTITGNITETDSLNVAVRSNPGLPQADVISLITTGDLSNTQGGIPTLAQGGLNTAAEILTDEIINRPLARATDRLFGLNRFEIDPIISGTQRGNPTARLTVGRQINRNLLITYSTNLSEEQNQVLALEYRVSNRLSFVAQYEQRSLSNVTQKNNVFSFEVRLRKRF